VSGVRDLHKTLVEINAIRGQMARGMQFRGFGPPTLATTGILALLAAAVQAHWLKNPKGDIMAYLALWAATAAVSLIIIGIETMTRSRHIHSGFSMEMIHSAIEEFLPAIVAGLLLTMVLLRCAAQSLWMFPCLWQMIFSLGVFASCRFLPQPMFAVGVWYLGSGLTCHALGDGERALSPWVMGVPFGIGQMLVAAVLQFGYLEVHGKA
jgi:hypothetical protein